jgi:hypothetical protein
MDPARKQRLSAMLRFTMSPEKSARLIVDAVEQDRFKLVFGAESRVLDHLKRLAPVGTLQLLRLANRPEAAGDVGPGTPCNSCVPRSVKVR